MARSRAKHYYQTAAGVRFALNGSQAFVYDGLLASFPVWRETRALGDALGTDEVKARMAEINKLARAAGAVLIEKRPSRRSSPALRKLEYRAAPGVCKLQPAKEA